MVNNGSMQVLVLLLAAPPFVVGAVIGFSPAYVLLPVNSPLVRIGFSLILALASGVICALIVLAAMQ